MTRRFDTFKMSPARKTREGYLVCSARFAKVGVLEYQNPDGTSRRELVTRDELQRPESIKSLAFSPITDGHPPDALTADNTRGYQRGTVLDAVDFDGTYQAGEIMITDKELIEKIESGQKRETSAGYDLEDIEIKSGVDPKHGSYDAIQRGRIANHVAIVERGRAGSEVALRLDSEDTDVGYWREDSGCFWGYEGPGDPRLPEHVKELDDEDRCHWIGVFEAEYWKEGRRQNPPDKRHKAAEDAADAALGDAINSDTKEIETMKNKQDNEDVNLDERADALIDLLKKANARLDADEEEGKEDEDGEMSEKMSEFQELLGQALEMMKEYKEKADEQTDKYQDMKGQFDAMMQEIEDGKSDMDGEEKEDMDDPDKEDMDEEHEDRADSKDDHLAYFNERQDLLDLADAYRMDAEDVKSLGNKDLKRKIVEEHFGDERTDSKPGEIHGAYKVIKRLRERRDASYKGASKKVREGRKENGRSDEASAQKKYNERTMNAWRADRDNDQE